MMVIFISQCEKNAIKKTRRVLDTFANRISDNTWQTIITQEGLEAVQKLLKQTASKSTAVSCHWIRTRARSDLIWIVGNKNKFNSEGIVPVNSTQKNILKDYKESDWKYLHLIKALVAVSALFHDWGKASDLFQEKLKPTSKNNMKADPIRHEWVSCLLLYTFIKECEKNNNNWIECLINGNIDEKSIIKNVSQNIQKPLTDIPAVAQVVFWLIVSHHRLPTFSQSKTILEEEWQGEEAESIDDVLQFITQSWGYENKKDNKEYEKRVKKCFMFSNALLLNSKEWIKEVKKWAGKLNNQLSLFEQSLNDGSYRVVLHYARLSLMLGDHFYSSQDADISWKNSTNLFANTDPRTKQLKQKLDEHIVGVQKSALKIAHSLIQFENEPPKAENIKSLKKLSPKEFAWQDKAVNILKEHNIKNYGFFAVNMASTGCGKTFANAKIMQAISDDQKSLRYVLALGLRTLTLQTGDEYREKIGLSKSELGVLIGSKAVSVLHNEANKSVNQEEINFGGSESLEGLFDEDIEFDSDLPKEGLATLIKNEKDKKFLYAPVLACTIDHLMGAVETKRGGKYILPSLRLSSSDLVIDEIDDFSGSDLIAIGRLVFLAAMLGRKVMISSATIPPDLAEGYFNIYKKGWNLFTKTREVKNSIYCAWIDEFKTKIEKLELNDGIESYRKCHNQFVTKRETNLIKQEAKRKAEIVMCKSKMNSCESKDEDMHKNSYFDIVQDAIIQKHQHHHTVDTKTGKKVSFGVVRMANIDPCVALTSHLQNTKLDETTELKVMSYHSRQILLLRHIQEQHLDKVLKRKEIKNQNPKAFEDEIIRSHLDNSNTTNIIFVLVATPVEEVGRDHDFDWAIIEPSSYRSIIQLAGRVRRHRMGEVQMPNIALMQYNYKAFKDNDKNKKYFTKPGYEERVSLNTHDLKKLVNEESLLNRLDAIPRIKKPQELDYKNSLADLEHYVTQIDLTTYNAKGADNINGFINESWFLTAHPQIFHKFRESQESTKLFFLYNEKKDEIYIAQRDDYGEFVNREGVFLIEKTTDENENNLWLKRDYKKALKKYAKKINQNMEEISRRFGELSFIYKEGNEYKYSDQFGLIKI
jgi:CRISPR-associated endonuclease/helicase Cas3